MKKQKHPYRDSKANYHLEQAENAFNEAAHFSNNKPAVAKRHLDDMISHLGTYGTIVNEARAKDGRSPLDAAQLFSHFGTKTTVQDFRHLYNRICLSLTDRPHDEITQRQMIYRAPTRADRFAM